MSPNRLLLRYAQRYPVQVLLTIILGFSGALFNGVSTALIVPVLLNFLDQKIDLMGAPPLIQKIISPFDGIPEPYRLSVMLGAIVLAIILKNLAAYSSTLVSGALTRSLMADLRKAGLRLLLEVDLDYYSKVKIGDLVNRLGGEVGKTASSINAAINMIVVGITVLVFIGLLLSLSWQLTIASTVLLSLVALANQFAVLRSKYFGQQLSEASKAYSIKLLEILSGIRLVKAVGNEEREYQSIQQLIQEREKLDFRSQANSAMIGPINEITSIIALILIVFLGRLFFASDLQLLSTVLLTYLLVLFRLLPFIGQLNTYRSHFANASASVAVVNDFLRQDNKPFMPSGSHLYTSLQQEIRFNQVSFYYPTNSQDLVLKGVDLYLPRNTTLALVGASGAGKSTLADLLPRFYDPAAGSITLDGRDLREFDLKSLRKAMGIVSQDTFLFNDSVRNNIIYGRPEATEDELIDAVKRANAWEFIERLPQGFDTLIGDRGVLLSGGQRQRLAIARALLQNPEILILDEATSALDTVSERLVQAALDNLSRDRTTLVIAHRLSTVQKADQIAVLEKGEVVEVGTHEQLLQKNGYYTRLYTMQFAETAKNQISEASRREVLMQTSYAARAQLNVMLGSLRMMVDNIVDGPQERIELTEEAYRSAMQLLGTLELLEAGAKSSIDEYQDPYAVKAS